MLPRVGGIRRLLLVFLFVNSIQLVPPGAVRPGECDEAAVPCGVRGGRFGGDYRRRPSRSMIER